MGNLAATTSRAASSYSETAEAVIAALGTDARSGLSEAEVRRRLERDGPNELTAEKPVSAWRKFLAQFTDVLVILLLIATAISAVLWLIERESRCPMKRSRFSPSCCSTRSWATSRSRAPNRRWPRCVRCRPRTRPCCGTGKDDSSRGGNCARRHHLIEEGDTIPADARLIQSTALQTAEAALTGESLPVSKETAPVGRRSQHSAIATT